MITILFLAADVSNKLSLDEEARAIDYSLRTTGLREHFKLVSHWAVKVRDLQELLLRYKPEIVHFSGHGNSNSEIVLVDDYGKPFALPINATQHLFSTLSENLQCVILNSCYSEILAKAIAQEINYVIGMSDQITDKAATTFSMAFYRAIGYGESIKTAFELGINQINLENLGEHETPKLVSLQNNQSEVVLTNKMTSVTAPISISEYEIKTNKTQINEIIDNYVAQYPIMNEAEVLDRLSHLVNFKINYKPNLPDDTGSFEVSSVVGDIFVRFIIESQITEKYSFDTVPLSVEAGHYLAEKNMGYVNKKYFDRRVFFTLLATDNGLSEYEKPTVQTKLSTIWASWVEKEPFQELPFATNSLFATEIKRGFYGEIHGIASRGVDNDEPQKFLKLMNSYEYEFPLGLNYAVSNQKLAGVFPSQYKVLVEAMPIYKVIYKRLDARTKGWLWKDHYKALVKGKIHLFGTDNLQVYSQKEVDM